MTYRCNRAQSLVGGVIERPPRVREIRAACAALGTTVEDEAETGPMADSDPIRYRRHAEVHVLLRNPQVELVP